MKSLAIGLVLAASSILSVGASAAAFSNNNPVAICDLCTVTSTITVGSHMMIGDITVGLNIDHPFDADLIISVIAPNGASVLLSNRRGGSGGQNYTDTIFDDEALVSIASGVAYAPFTGSFRPEQLLSAFDGIDAFGNWTLSVTDQEAGDSGTINSWKLDIIGAAVPEPTSIALVSLGLLGFAASRRKSAK